LKGKTVLLTGATYGIGKATAFAIAQAGATLVIVARDPQKGKDTVEELKARTGNQSIHLLMADLSRQADVRKLAKEFLETYPRLDVLVNNAGVMLGKRTVTADGLETMFAVNHLAPFLLTNLLLDRLKASAPSRIVGTASTAHKGAVLEFDNLNGEKHFSGYSFYGRSKLANILFTYALARRLNGTQVTANCFHPGVVRTHLFNSGAGTRFFFVVAWPFLTTPEKAAKTALYLASSPEVAGVSGKYFYKSHEVASSSVSHDVEVQEKLWKASEELCGLRSPPSTTPPK
jgi:NAD(P)-dependent dehydrogenase (short-subunit alcohol dehydrogenase family)